MSRSNELDDLLAEVAADEACSKLQEDLLAYAARSVAEHLPEVRANLANHGVSEVDLLWPGAGYNSVACGGNFEVLHLLEKEGILRVGNIVGASGGAASSILALADDEGGSKTLLRSYMVYAKWAARTWDFQITRTAPLWRMIYLRAIESDAAFERVSKRGFVAVAAGLNFKTWILHDFADRGQCVQAYEASGEASLKGLFAGHRIDGIHSILGRCADGGGISAIPHRSGHVLYHNTFYGYATSCTLESIGVLFRKGVDETVQALASPDLKVSSQRGSGGVALVPQGGVMPLKEEFTGLARSATFLNASSKGQLVMKSGSVRVAP